MTTTVIELVTYKLKQGIDKSALDASKIYLAIY